MRYKKIRTKSSRARLIQKIQDLIREILKIERGDKCELCDCVGVNVGVFHILPVGAHPKLRFSFENLLLSCWHPCHFSWHHDFYKAKEIEKKIIKLRGLDYEQKLRALEVQIPKIDTFYLNQLYLGFKFHLQEIA